MVVLRDRSTLSPRPKKKKWCPRSLAAVALALFTFGGGIGAAVAETTDKLAALLDPEIKFVFVGGKGGVGKTTTSSALAAQLAKDKKILLVSTDPAHSTSDAWAQQFGREPEAVKQLPNLEVVELDPKAALRKEMEVWDDLFAESGLVGGQSDFAMKAKEAILGLQGIDEAIALANAYTFLQDGRYDKVVFDTAPTGHTLRLLDLPSLISESLKTITSMQSTILDAVDGFASLTGLAGGGATGLSPSFKKKIEVKLRQYQKTADLVAGMLANQAKTRFVVVCIAEHLSVSESKKLLAELRERGVKASHVIVNQLLSVSGSRGTSGSPLLTDGERRRVKEALESAESSALVEKTMTSLELYASRAELQKKYLNSLRNAEESVRGVELIEVPLLPGEVVGAEAIVGFSELLLRNPAVAKEVTKEWTDSGLTTDSPDSPGSEEDQRFDAEVRQSDNRSKTKTTSTPTSKQAPEDLAAASSELGSDEIDLSPEKIKETLLKNKQMQKALISNPKLMTKVMSCGPQDKGCYARLLQDPEVLAQVKQFLQTQQRASKKEKEALPRADTKVDKGKKKKSSASSAAAAAESGGAGKKKKDTRKRKAASKKSGAGDLGDLLGGLGGGAGGLGDLLGGLMGGGGGGGLEGMLNNPAIQEMVGGADNMKSILDGMGGMPGIEKGLNEAMENLGGMEGIGDLIKTAVDGGRSKQASSKRRKTEVAAADDRAEDEEEPDHDEL
eukprot:g14297.t1